MKEALGQTFIVNFIIVFTIIFITLFVGATSYTKALRIKNRIIDIIEEHDGYDSNAQAEIETYLKDVGYRIANASNNTCTRPNASVAYPDTSRNNIYDYCIFEFSTDKGTYYGVKSYMYLDIPIIGDHVKIGVYGETKIMDILS